MARWYGSTTERGLNGAHAADLKRLRAAHRDGDPCWRCGQPMYKTQALERDHIIDRVLGGADGPAVLAHASCNRSAGATLGNKIHGFKPAAAGRNVTCKTCGKPYHYAARACEICGAHYHPSYGEQRTCSRSCGVELRRRARGTAGSPRTRTCSCPSGQPHRCFVRISWRDCPICGRPFIPQGKRHRLTCSEECHVRQQAQWRDEYATRETVRERTRQAAREANDRLGEARGWPRGKGAYNVGREPWNKGASREW